ncbi:hypothetical protein MJN69_27255, partial [Salmonella enterica subsp. enterica serovar Kentucky]|nr:hypothetical protein [Salmonella enterica subsp. enterica serovar Kentucky]
MHYHDKFEVKYGSLMVGPAYRLSDNFSLYALAGVGTVKATFICHNRDTWDTHGGKEITVEDLMKEVVTYRHFMNASGGGVTASG